MNTSFRIWFLITAVLIPCALVAITLLALTETIGNELAVGLYFSVIPLLLVASIIIGRRQNEHQLPLLPTSIAVIGATLTVVYVLFML